MVTRMLSLFVRSSEGVTDATPVVVYDADRMSLALAVPSSVTRDNVNDRESDVDSLVKEGSSL